MRIINKKYLLTILLVGVILTGVIILKPAKEVKLDNVILKQEVNNKTFAMYKEDDDNNYVKVEDTKFPDMYVLNLTKSKCIDNNGNELNGVLSYENDKVTITSGNTTYCYLYFDKSLGLEIKDKNPNGLKTDAIRGEMYRFQGQQSDGINNYICFGTSDKDTCLKDTDHYMYRIIGIEAETGRVKVIKKEALNQTYQWHTSYVENKKLPDSVFFTAINGDKFLTNTDYVPEGWEEKIADNTWTYGDMWENDTAGAKQTGQGLYETETGKKETNWCIWSTQQEGGIGYAVQWDGNKVNLPGTTLYYKEISGKWTDTVKSKISLMNLSDYSYSVGDEAKCQYNYSSEDYSKCKTGWIHLSQNDTNNPPSVHEWTMSRFGWYNWNGAYDAFHIDSAGFNSTTLLSAGYSVRPVFFIDASQKLKSGIGTLEDPFIIEF